MSKPALFINGKWVEGSSAAFESTNPATGAVIWSGKSASASDIDGAVAAARHAFSEWRLKPVEARLEIITHFKELLEKSKSALAETIAIETGKTLWDSTGEVTAMIGKVAVSVKAYQERTGMHQEDQGGVHQILRHKPHGVLAVFGPYNFPGHLPNGHIVPALLAGNVVLFKPSEQTPKTAEQTMELWEKAGMPAGVIQLLQGERDTGVALAAHPDLDGLLFTGSSETGQILHKQFAGAPHKILALEMGGNNPLVVWAEHDVKAAAYLTIQSAFISSGQRCSCARRLIIANRDDQFLDELLRQTRHIRIGAYNEKPEPFMGPLISNREADRILKAQEQMVAKGGMPLLASKRVREGLPFISPGIIDVTDVADRPDREYFGPLLQIIRVTSFEEALAEANNTRYGLTAGLISDKRDHYEQFYKTVNAGIINWNRQTTGASSAMPFGGVGLSGNHHPSAYYASDYCAYPVASMEESQPVLPATLSPGLSV